MSATSADRSEFIRESMRRSWAERYRSYAETAALQTAKYAQVLVALVDPRPGERVLDVAAGPGVVALAAAQKVAPTGHVLATDLAPQWAEVIAERSERAGLSNLTFRAMSADALDLLDGTFDAALCQFGLMFVPDPVQALREMRRVLRSGGRLGVAVWSTADKVPHWSIISRRLAPHVAQPPPEQQVPTPLALGEPGLIERHVAAAGFQNVEVERRTLDFTFRDGETVWRERVEEGPPNVREAIQRLGAEERQRLHDALVADLERYRRGSELVLPSEAIFVTARS